MAPAVLATLNEPSFQGQCGAVFMRKFTNQSVSENTNPLFNPNPNPNFDSSKQFEDSSDYGSYTTFNVAGYTSSQLRELKNRFTSELEQIRVLRERIESGTFETQQQHRDYTIPEVSAVRSAPTNSFAGETNDLGPKKKKQKKNVSSGPKRCNQASDPESEKLISGMLNSTCNQILGKLMKHKWAWVFNTPVDVVGLGLHDYHLIVKKPMDLGTVKLNLEKGFYSSPVDFATDVRLTFNNAMTYNPRGQDVFFMAEKLLEHFDGMFNPAFKKFEAQLTKLTGSSSSSRLLEPEFKPKPKQWSQNQNLNPIMSNANVNTNARKGTEQISIAKKLDSVKPKPPPPPPQPTLPPPQLVEPPRVNSPSPPPPPPPVPIPVIEEVEEAVPPPDVSEATKAARKGKLPKPKAKDPNKRLMTMEEKSKLGMNLQDLPPEKLGQLVSILRKRNGHLAQDGDEIELDIEAVDNETLWELDRFVTNYKKMASKIKRQGFIRNVSTPPRNMVPMMEMGSAEKRVRKGGDAGGGEEDIDIGEDIPIEDYPSVEIERDGTATTGVVVAAAASSSSSGSSSSSSGSSSSDSGSGGSSSGSDSDADSVQSPFVDAKEAQ